MFSLQAGCNNLLDHLVGEREELGRKLDAERLRGLEIDRQFEQRRHLRPGGYRRNRPLAARTIGPGDFRAVATPYPCGGFPQ
jgi:hypothetical protein